MLSADDRQLVSDVLNLMDGKTLGDMAIILGFAMGEAFAGTDPAFTQRDLDGLTRRISSACGIAAHLNAESAGAA